MTMARNYPIYRASTRGMREQRVKAGFLRLGYVLAAIWLGATVISGCQNDPRLSLSQSHALMKLKVGMSREEVVAQLGEPHKQDAVGDMLFLHYSTVAVLDKEAESVNPVAIMHGKVVGVGPAYEAKIKGLPSPKE